jgi:hypothetical protein
MKKEKKSKKKNNKQIHTGSCGPQPVASVAAPWPPPWLADPPPVKPRPEDSEGPPAINTGPRPSRGWKMPSGTVLCAVCHPQPNDAGRVVLAGQGEDLHWVKVTDSPVFTEHSPEDPALPQDQQNPNPAASLPEDASEQQLPKNGKPQWT